jgi:acyl dehydratase
LFEFVPNDENRISVSVTPGTPVSLTFDDESLLFAVVFVLPDAESSSSPEFPHAASTSVATTTTAARRRRRDWVGDIRELPLSLRSATTRLDARFRHAIQLPVERSEHVAAAVGKLPSMSERCGPFDARLDRDVLAQYAPIAVVTQLWDAQEAARAALVPPDVQRDATGGVHGEHDVVLHRPITAGEPLRIWVDRHGTRPAGRNALVTLRYTVVDAHDDVVAEQWWTTVYLGTTCAATGEPAPDHAFGDDARRHPVGTYTVAVDADMPRRYAEVSGDWSAHHFDVDAARRSGFDRPFLHGLCTMTLCARGVVDVAAGGDPDRVRRIAVRFATPTFLDEQLAVALYDAGHDAIAFEAQCAGATVITHGRAELFA